MQTGRHHRALRAPSQHGEFLIQPDWPDLGEVIDQNCLLFASHDFDLCGRSARSLRQSAREVMLGAAQEYTSAYRNQLPQPSLGHPSRVICTGHQPELFHAGVWFKNFVLDRLAQQFDAWPVHLIIDNDVCKSTAISLPTGRVDAPRREHVAFDRPLPDVPLEDRRIAEPSLFADFGRRAAAAVSPFVEHPLVQDFWITAVDAGRRSDRLGRTLAQMRHRVEEQCGLRTLELPLSQVCDAEPFLWFAASLVVRAEELWQLHNQALTEYRRANRLRSRTHPVPDLSQQSDWTELPLWIWSTQDSHRRRLFTRTVRGDLQLSGLGGALPARVVGRVGDAESVLNGLLDLRQAGIRIRPRALITTLFTRLFLCDFFIHGIGGAKYDALTDVLIERFFGVPAPDFLTATATFHLPIDTRDHERPTAEPAKQLLRSLRYHPERFLTAADERREEVRYWVEQKSRWLNTQAAPTARKMRHQAITQANAALQPYVQQQREDLERRVHDARQSRRRQRILASREYSFCLFPFAFLRDKLFDGLS